MAKQLRIAVELGPKGRKFAAFAPDWPGLERGGRSPEEAVATLRSYVERYQRVAEGAGLGAEFGALAGARVVDRYVGPGSTDFWGISFGCSRLDRQRTSPDELERQLALLRSCWAYFDDVRARVSPTMRKGPRGGGRDRDHIVRHVLGVEQDWARKVGVSTPKGAVVTDRRGLARYRDDYCEAIRGHHAEGRDARTWPLRYLVRHSAYHTMDHAWELQDKDLSPRRPPRA